MANKDKYEILHKYWGYDSFRELQEEIIDSILEGHDTLGMLPTGGGKSLTFQVPSLMTDGLTVVITPIISLMKDQVDNLVKRGIKALYLYSGLTIGEMRRAIEKCINGNYKFLYISPERLNSQNFIANLRQMPVTMIVVDEAHCISQWGYDFRPSYLSISKVREIYPEIPILALTASATPKVADDIVKQLKFHDYRVFKKSFSRSNLRYVVRQATNKDDELIHILQSVGGSAIVYARSRRKTKEIAEKLTLYGIPASHYHAGLSNEEKNDIQNKWVNNQVRVMVATNAFGMGIDKPDVRLVVHIDLPSSLEEYYQEAGRAGRDGGISYAVTIASKNDKSILSRRVAELFPEKDFILRVYEMLGNFLEVPVESGYNQIYEFNFVLFCRTFKFPVTPTYNALKILTQSRYIEFVDEVETQSRVMIIANKSELYNIEGETPETAYVLQALLRSYTGLFADYVFINEAEMSYRHNISEETIYKSLLELTRIHILHYIPRKRTPYIIYTTSRELPKYVVIPKSAYEDRRELIQYRSDIMLKYAFADDFCRENIILEYFGEHRNTDCGHCDYCIAKRQLSGTNPKQEVIEGIMYMLSLKPRSMSEFYNTLSFPRQTIKDIVRELVGESLIKYDDMTGIFSL